ncbi:MAG: ferrochelatase [Acidobacteria bacterium]|nr:ferrochelatase [Acidobacteriota bacterium]
MSDNTSATLLLAHGTPDTLSQMADYLHKVTGGRPMPAEVVQELQHRYAEIGLRDEPLPDGPPLTRWTLLQGRLLSDLLGQNVYVGMRNWHPYIADVVAQMKSDGIQHARVLCLAPQNSRTSTGLYRRALMEAVGDSFTVDFIAGWADEPLLAQAFAERMWPAWAEACAATQTRVPILFTAHAVPCRTIMSGTVSNPASPSARPGAPVPADGIQNYGQAQEPDPYPVECKQTAIAIAKALRPLGLTDDGWFFAFQSQGIAGAPWIGPTVPDTLKALAEAGHKAVVLQPVGFLCDHVEILYDIDIDFKAQAAALGMQLSRAASLNDSPTLIRAIRHALSRPSTRLDPNAPPDTPVRPRPTPVAAAS